MLRPFLGIAAGTAAGIAAALLLIGCAESLSGRVVTALQSAQEKEVLTYQIPVDGGSPARAMARGAYCDIDAVLGYYNAPSFDAGGAVTCKAKKQ